MAHIVPNEDRKFFHALHTVRENGTWPRIAELAGWLSNVGDLSGLPSHVHDAVASQRNELGCLLIIVGAYNMSH